jgi:DNA-3-methyladenine glycosylase
VSDRPLPVSLYDRDVFEVARDLLGALVVTGSGGERVAVRLTEVEAYAGETDPGSHAYRGKTARNATMFGPPGHAYVYFTYGMHFCMNLVCGPEGLARAVLLRAGVVVAGHRVAGERRAGIAERDWARGPARLTKTLAVDRSYDGADVTSRSSRLRVLPGEAVGDDAVRIGPRVGVSGGAQSPWRFWIDGERSVSAYRPAVRRHRRESRS